MTNGEEISKTIYKTLTEISEREKKRAIQEDNYEGALIAGFLEGLFREAERSLEIDR